MISKTTAYIVGLLVFGSLNTLTTKIQFELASRGIDGEKKHFKKPWFGTLTMFLGMCIVLVIHFINVLIRQRPQKTKDMEVHLLQSGKDNGLKHATFWQASKLIAIPAILDLIATALCFVGILFNSASVFQMLRGSMIIFSTILSVVFLRKKLHAYHWTGVALCCAAIVLVSYSNMMATVGSAASSIPQSKVIFGMVLIVVGQVIQASQVVIEEKLLRGYTGIEPFQIVGMEGVWGTLAMLLIFFPALYLIAGSDTGSCQENLLDTIVMMQNNKGLQYLVLLYVFSVFTYNMSGILVTYALSSVHRTMLEASRTAVIWIIDLVIHYWIYPSSSFGEQWTSWSWLQLAGFGLLILGQSVYSELVRVPGLFYPPRPIVAIESIQASPASVRYNVMLPEGADDEVFMVGMADDGSRSKGR
jgi:drug/metabolite transporter (DMT)-like permease